jgi:cell division septal protein FtsQ
MKTEDLRDEIEVPSDLESRLESLIDRLSETEKQAKRKIKMRLLTVSIAASIILVLSVGLLLKTEEKPFVSSVSVSSGIRHIDDPETAYRELKKALELMSENLNKGLNELDVNFTNELEKSNKIINKTLIKY